MNNMRNSKGFEENLFYNGYGSTGREGWMRCNSGVYINILEPNPIHLLVEDIAHGLSNMPRFGGQFPFWYSVSDHCIYCVNYMIDRGYKKSDIFSALMHDASEAYIMDIISPLKKLLTNYSEIEDNFMKILSKKFEFDYPLNQIIKEIDLISLKSDWRFFIGEEKYFFERDRIDSKMLFLELFEKFRPSIADLITKHDLDCRP